MKVNAKLAGMDESVSVEYDIPENLAASIEKLTEEVVYSRFRAALVVDLQSFMRNKIKQQTEEGGSLDEAALQTAVDEWVPGVKRAGKSAEEKIADLLAGLPEDERNAILEKHIG
jgi:DNA-directed RNA polymerase specialized sigma24 family protein